jgi:uncharacterized protein
MTEVTTRHDVDGQRYEAVVDGESAGFAEYELHDGLVVFTHTVVDDAFEGQGVGSQLARGALDDVRREGSRRVVPVCSFIKGWIESHPDYADLVAEDPGRG